MYFEALNFGTNKEIEPKDIFEMAYRKKLSILSVI